ncbi:MAG: flagellar biosynthesis protein FlgL, partial [Lachnospiraceae bacterium]|nr:flagellar biosynthesis protein FlgL [Lachnospiraceae bacterium]
MRITNSMITDNAAGNINGTKVLVDKRNTQMTTQKKISRPSQDPVIAIRSLRLQTSLNKVNQYYEKNIPDAESWMDVTETALTNIKNIVTDMRTLCVNGATGTLTESDRNTILSQLKALQ